MIKKFSLLLLFLSLACNSSKNTTDSSETGIQSSAPDPADYASTITEEELREHLYIYASDEFEGRETGKPGQKKAVEYIKEAYMAMGIPAAKADGDYFQDVPLEMANIPEGYIQLNEQRFEIGEDFYAFSPISLSQDEFVYAGYGIETDGYTDYEGLDVNGKVVLLKSGEPKAEDGSYVLSGTSEKSPWSNMAEAVALRRDVAQGKGAKAVLYYDPENLPRYRSYFNFMRRNNSGQMSIKSDGTKPVIALLEKKMALALNPELLNNNQPSQLNANLELALSSANDAIKSENVVAVIRGREKPEEYLVISSHLDHIGVTAGGSINNGADDDGSGTVAMLEIAEAFKEAAAAGNGPMRSIVFLHVTGEEKGLLGSQYYTDNDPIFPLEQTVANLNIDMIGRIDPKRNGSRNYIYLIGSDKLSTELHRLSEEVNTKYTQLEFDYTFNDENDPNRFYYRSDHYNFAKNNIPIIFYFNGTHEDYHRPGDTPDKINYDLLEVRSRLIFHTAWEVANRENRVVVDGMAK